MKLITGYLHQRAPVTRTRLENWLHTYSVRPQSAEHRKDCAIIDVLFDMQIDAILEVSHQRWACKHD